MPLKKNQILIRYGTDYKQMTRALLEESDLETLIREKWKSINNGKPLSAMRIALKPNLVSPSLPEEGATTHPQILAGILEYLKERGFGQLFIAEGSWVGARTREAYEVCGYDRLCRDYEVPFRDMQKEKTLTREAGGLTLHLCQAVEEMDFLINIPVLKGHCQTRITCALKNMKGLIPNAEKRRFHALGLHKPIAAVNTLIHQDFIVVDNICGDLDFEDGGNPVVMNRILTARDPVLMDAYVCHLLHYEIKEVPYIMMAEEMGVGSADLSGADIRVCGMDQAKPLPIPHKVMEVAECVEDVESCSACYGYLIPALEQLGQEMSLTPFRNTRICIGQGWRGRSGELGIGTCTRGFSHYLEGCPPTETQMVEFLREFAACKK